MQQIIKGIGTAKRIDSLLHDLHCDRFLLVKGASFPSLSIKDDIESVGIERVDFSEFTPNPLYEQVKKGVEIFNAMDCNAIVAVGGGSCIDVAKCIKLYCNMDQNKVYMQQEYEDSAIPLIAIPTTAGTGSESTVHAVIYWQGKKQSICHSSILPNVVVLDHSVLKSLPLYQKKCTMMDAFCQGIESWWSVNSTDESKVYSRKAVKLIIENWEKYIFENNDEASANIMLAANYAGRAICITQTTAAHAMSYKITSLYKFPHGHAVAVCLPEVWTYMLKHIGKCIDSRGEIYVLSIFNDIAKAMGVDNAKLAIEKFHGMMSKMEMGAPISVNRDEDLTMLSTSVNPVRLKNNPMGLNEHILRSLYEIIIK